MNELVQWLASTGLSNWIAGAGWVVPTVQCVHILAIGIIFGSVLMLDLRVLGWAGSDQTMTQATGRYSPWIWGALIVLAMSGGLLIFGEPGRELLSTSFWVKMAMLAIGSGFVVALQLSLKRHHETWDVDIGSQATTKILAFVTFFVWIAVIALGRLIAWDAQIWGALFPRSVS
ncbi:MAG: hypothetical protein P4M09_26795 [Devosia sp.]|nr:hypothetical protein [Devosia sp.]